MQGVAESDIYFGVPSSELFPVPDEGQIFGVRDEEKKEFSECTSDDKALEVYLLPIEEIKDCIIE